MPKGKCPKKKRLRIDGNGITASSAASVNRAFGNLRSFLDRQQTGTQVR